ncbi:Organic cation transporter protein [Holothuria leucospilota]|uniref:Organic cation transporter protein n=1 Tax=Holothuria leucospilota TaxID=206669 RepID=A0A9Q1H082_HOLLE|nr:Organic cation transporter protein [Holothuria leucospilota]
MKFDDVLGLIGDFGRYQILMLSLVCLTATPQAMVSLSSVFILGDMDHWCSVEEWSHDVSDCKDLLSISEQEYLDCIYQYRESSIPKFKENGEVVYSECEKYNAEYPAEWSSDYYASNYTSETIKCDEGWVYDQSQYESTVGSDLDLVCDKKFYGDTSQSVFFFGYLVGSVFFGSMADLIGRYYTFFFSCGLNSLIGLATAFTTNYWVFTVLRFFNGAANIAMYIMAFIIATEFVGPSKRVFAGILICVTFAFGYMMLALMGFLVRDWRNLQIILSALILPCLLLMPILPESARWLISKKKYDKATKLITKVAERNKTKDKLPPNLEDVLAKADEVCHPLYYTYDTSNKTITAIDLFRTPNLRLHTLNMMFNWVVNALVYLGLSLSSTEFGSNPYVSFFISGLVEVPAYLVCIPLINSFLGRRWSTSILEIIGGVACLMTILTPEGAWRTTIAMLGKFCISASFAIIYIYSAEIFPTAARSAGVGLCSTCGRIGSILGPLLVALDEIWKPLPLLIFGLVSIIAGILVIFLPETRGKALPETLQECSRQGR